MWTDTGFEKNESLLFTNQIISCPSLLIHYLPCHSQLHSWSILHTRVKQFPFFHLSSWTTTTSDDDMTEDTNRTLDEPSFWLPSKLASSAAAAPPLVINMNWNGKSLSSGARSGWSPIKYLSITILPVPSSSQTLIQAQICNCSIRCHPSKSFGRHNWCSSVSPSLTSPRRLEFIPLSFGTITTTTRTTTSSTTVISSWYDWYDKHESLVGVLDNSPIFHLMQFISIAFGRALSPVLPPSSGWWNALKIWLGTSRRRRRRHCSGSARYHYRMASSGGVG